MRIVIGRPCAAETHEKDLAVIEGLLEEIHAEIQTEPERRAHLKQLQDELSQLEETRKLQESALEDQRRLKTALDRTAAVPECVGRPACCCPSAAGAEQLLPCERTGS